MNLSPSNHESLSKALSEARARLSKADEVGDSQAVVEERNRIGEIERLISQAGSLPQPAISTNPLPSPKSPGIATSAPTAAESHTKLCFGYSKRFALGTFIITVALTMWDSSPSSPLHNSDIPLRIGGSIFLATMGGLLGGLLGFVVDSLSFLRAKKQESTFSRRLPSSSVTISQASPPTRLESDPDATNVSVERRLRQLNSLLEKKLISKEAFDAMQREILASL